ncbi:MAG: magnesium-dependent phosphatase-1 [Thermoplasmata archaeon]
MTSRWIVFFDLDGTLWDHLDISATNPPFTRISDSSISDSMGVKISLLPGAVDFIKWVRSNGGIISTCSWNEYDKAMDALKCFGLEKLFDFHKISTNPNKFQLMEQVLEALSKENISIDRKLLFYIDDRDIHIKDVKERFPEMKFFNIWKNGLNFEGVKKEISARLKES